MATRLIKEKARLALMSGEVRAALETRIEREVADYLVSRLMTVVA